ncbi:class II aldolase/adducin family protein [Lichenifustis flavocetrariae]|uniref:class II aldolase/adducin family protein n=1 Tax=Lichenifustis flavocetrariae TaxID=2949735 RepID=UPI003D09FDDC
MTLTNASMGELDPARLSRLDAAGALTGGNEPIKEAFLDRVMYARRTDAQAVVHLHSTHSVEVSCLRGLDRCNCLPPLTAYYVMRVGLPVVPYCPPDDESLALELDKLAGAHHAVLLAITNLSWLTPASTTRCTPPRILKRRRGCFCCCATSPLIR